MTSKKQPSERARKYVKNKISGMSDYQAAVKAGYSPNTAIAAAQNIENPSVKNYMIELMDRKGLTDDKLIEFLNDGLTSSNKIFGTGDSFVETPDYAVRHKYLDTALKLKNKFPDVNVKHKGDPDNPIKESIEIHIIEDKPNE